MKELNNTFKDGAEFGYNKGYRAAMTNANLVVRDPANEWHYVKDKLPEKSDTCLYDLKPVNVAVWTINKVELNVLGTYWDRREGRFLCLDEVYAWCEVPEPPEVKK